MKLWPKSSVACVAKKWLLSCLEFIFCEIEKGYASIEVSDSNGTNKETLFVISKEISVNSAGFTPMPNL